MFVRKLVEKASRKYIGTTDCGINGLVAEDVSPRLAFHYGVPSDSSSMAYDPIQAILAIATRNGQIKLFGRDNTQALLQSEEAVPTKFLQFLENQGILLNVTIQNHIEVWDIVKRQLCSVHIFDDEITSFAVVKQSSYMYVGDRLGNITIMKLDNAMQHLVQMQYRIPFSESHGATEAGSQTSVMHILLQPMAESKRVLIIFRDGHICLWGMQESKVIFTAGGSTLHSSNSEPKIVVSACWACSVGSKVVVGYNTGDIFLWAVPVISDEKTESVSNKKELHAASNIPLLKLNLGYKTDKVPIVSLKWFVGDGKNTRLYVNGSSDLGSSCSFQVIILNENSEARTIKLVLPLTEACLAMELISCFNDRNKHKQNALVLLLKSGRLCLYDDSQIENYLLQCQSKSSPTLPTQLMVKLPFGDSTVTVAQLYTGNSSPSSQMDKEHTMLANKYPYFLSINMKERDFSSTCFNGFSKTQSLYVTGHHDGAINIWDASSPLLLLILSIKQQNEDGSSSCGTPVTSLSFDVSSQILASGHKNGLVRIIMFKKEQFTSENIFSFLQGKQGGGYTVRSVKLEGSIISLNLNPDLKHLAIGTHKGSVSVVDMEGITILYQIQIPSQQYSGIISLQFQNYAQNGTEKNVLLVGSGDSSVFALEEDRGSALSTSPVQTKKPSRALLMQILDASPGACMSDIQDVGKEISGKETTTKQSLLLLCSENAVRLYSLSHVIQGIKKVYGKKKLSGTCCHASVIYGPSLEVGLVLIFASGKVEIRSIPDLNLIKEALLRGFANSISEPQANANSVLCTSTDGGLVAVNGDQEILFFSFLSRKDTYGHLEHISQVYKKDIVTSEEGHSSLMNAQKEKKGIFSMVMKDLKGNKTKHSEEINTKDSSVSTCDELSAILSTVNFPPDAEGQNSLVENDEDAELDIDDIDLEDAEEKQKRPNFAVLNKQKIGKKLQALKGKLKPKAEEKVNTQKNKDEEEKIISDVDQIKKKYGYTVNNESSIAKMAESKLRENVQKLQGIGLRTSEMQNTAQSFSSMANELLRAVQHDKSS